MDEIPFYWDAYLEKGMVIECETCAYGPNPHYHVGRGTDLEVMLFHANLTERDKAFLQRLRITWQCACER